MLQDSVTVEAQRRAIAPVELCADWKQLAATWRPKTVESECYLATSGDYTQKMQVSN